MVTRQIREPNLQKGYLLQLFLVLIYRFTMRKYKKQMGHKMQGWNNFIHIL